MIRIRFHVRGLSSMLCRGVRTILGIVALISATSLLQTYYTYYNSTYVKPQEKNIHSMTTQNYQQKTTLQHHNSKIPPPSHQPQKSI